MPRPVVQKFHATKGKYEMNELSRANPAAYICPMHASVRHSSPGKCPKCGMALVPENTSFAFLRHMTGSRKHLAIMGVLMVAAMAAAMMMFMR
jgi:hypothetical protein